MDGFSVFRTGGKMALVLLFEGLGPPVGPAGLGIPPGPEQRVD